jgi:hypothetical protein
MGGVVVSKCANPECVATFRYFHLGKLFRWEVELGFDRGHALGDRNEMEKPRRRIEFYWLCEECAQKMTLVYEKGAGVSTHPHPHPDALKLAAGF